MFRSSTRTKRRTTAVANQRLDTAFNRRQRGKAVSTAACIESLESRRLLSVAIASGQTIAASIGAKAEMDSYTISGVKGGTILASAGETTAGSPIDPKVAIYGPGNVLLTSGYGTTGLTVGTSNLPSTGTYTVVVSDYYATAVGGYDVTAVSIGTGIALQTGGDGGPIASGVTKNGSLALGDIDAFTINGVKGGTILATAGETAVASLDTQLLVYSPEGVLLTSGYTTTGLTVGTANLPETGTYTIVVRDYYGSGVGSYAITPLSIGTGITPDPGGDGGPIASGVTKTGTLPAGDLDAFTITGQQGGTILATAAETATASLDTQLLIWV